MMPSTKTLAVTCLALASQMASAWPTTSEYASILTRQEDVAEEYDYIIVGGGTSGLTVGDRLTEDGKTTVLVIEYGLYESQTGMNTRRMFNITSQPNPELNGRRFNVGIGAVVGGSSAVNGQVFLRGTREEHDAWRELGGPNSTWDWEGILPYYRKGINFSPPDVQQASEFNITYDMRYWGTTSKIFATFGKGAIRPVIKVLYSAMSKIPGVSVPVDSGAGETGLYWYPISQDPQNYTRSYARSGHWDGLNRPNYQMVVGSKVNRILWGEDMTATGVQFISRNSTTAEPVQVRARKEVILAAGTVHTPQILMLSGVGPTKHLEEAGIDVKIDLPGVGSNFQDHSYIPSIGFQWGTAPNVTNVGPNPTGQPSGLGASPNLAAMLGLPVVTPEKFEDLAKAYETQDPLAHLPAGYSPAQVEGYKAQQRLFGKLMRSKGVIFLEMMMSGPGGSVQNLHCMSRGTILLNTTQPEQEMIVDYRAGSNRIDLEVMVEIIKFMRRYMTTGELAQYEARETSPGATVASDDGLLTWARGVIIPSVYHPIGTCAKMPRELGGVVDEELQVYGTKKLRIVDASWLPTIVGATTSMAVYAIAEKAAAMIIEANAV